MPGVILERIRRTAHGPTELVQRQGIAQLRAAVQEAQAFCRQQPFVATGNDEICRHLGQVEIDRAQADLFYGIWL